MCCADLPSSYGTGRNSGMYLNTVGLTCKKGEGFNLLSPSDIPETLPEDVRRHTKGFESRDVPTRRGVLRFSCWRHFRQFPVDPTSSTLVVTITSSTASDGVYSGG